MKTQINETKTYLCFVLCVSVIFYVIYEWMINWKSLPGAPGGPGLFDLHCPGGPGFPGGPTKASERDANCSEEYN